MKSPIDKHKKSKSQLEPISLSNQFKVISMGLLDLELTLTLTEADVVLFKLSYESFKNQSYLKNFFEIYFLFLDRIVLSSKNESLTSALFLNKIQYKKTFIEFLSLNKMEYTEEDLFMKDIVKYVTDHNFLYIQENDIINTPAEVTLIIKYPHKDKIIFKFGQTNQVKENDLNLLNSKILTDFSPFNYLILNLNDFIQIYRQERINKESEEETNFLMPVLHFLREIFYQYKNLKIVIEVLRIQTNTDLLTLDMVKSLIEICSLGDLLIYEKKEALAFYKLINELREVLFTDNSEPNIDTEFKNRNSKILLQQFFIKEMKFKFKNKLQIKSAIFIDELNTIKFFDKNVENNLIYNNEYKIEICPKLCHFNMELVEQYKKEIIINYPLLKSIFLGGFFSHYVNQKTYFSCYLAGQEITKRLLDLFKTKTDLFLNSDYYLVTLNPDLIRSKKIEEDNKHKIENFVLDCVNKKQSTLKFYNPHQDKNLKTFFSSTGMILSGMKPKINSRSSQISRIYKNSPSKTPNRFFNKSMMNFNLIEVQKRPKTFNSVISNNRYPSAPFIHEKNAEFNLITPEHKPEENTLELPKLDVTKSTEKNFNSQMKKFVRIEKLSKI